MPSIIATPTAPAIAPNFGSTVGFQTDYVVSAGTTHFTSSLELMYFRNDYGADGWPIPRGAAQFFNHGTLWNRCLNDYLGTLIATNNFGLLTNTGLMVAEAPTGQAIAIQVRSAFEGLVNSGQIYALSYKRGAFALMDWAGSTASIVNTGVIAALRAPQTPDGTTDLVYFAYAIIRNNGGRVVNGESGAILAEGPGAKALWLHRGQFLAPGQQELPDIDNAGRIEAVATDSRFQSIAIEFNSSDMERVNVVNSGTIRADIAILMDGQSLPGSEKAPKLITNLASGIIDGAVLLSPNSETLVNRGFIEGAVDMGNGNDLIDNAGRILGAVQLGAGQDQYLGAGSAGAAEIFGEGGTDVLIGGAAADQLNGGDGNDWIAGGGGADRLVGGAGADRFVILAVGDSSAAGVDTIQSFESGIDKIDLTALAATSVDLSSAAGVTTLTAATVAGQVVIRIEGAVALADVLLAPTGTVLNGTDNAEALVAAGAVRELHGGAGDDLVVGSAGNDLLDGGVGADVMSGGAGDDVYLVEHPFLQADQNGALDYTMDRVLELDGQGIDEIRTSVAYTLPDGVEKLTFVGGSGVRVEGNRLDNVMTGNAVVNFMAGRDGNDVMIGGAGADMLEGGLGADRFVYLAVGDSTAAAFDDLFMFQSGLDKIDLSALVVTSISWRQETSNNGISIDVFQMVTVDTADGALTIKARSTTLAMTDFLGGPVDPDRQLYGTPDDDVLAGGSGNDTLVGGAGVDVMRGGGGNDVYFVDRAGDRVEESFGAGVDRVAAAASYTLAADAEVEALEAVTVAATDPFELIGNGFSQRIVGNNGANLLAGGGGNDTLYGLGGDDVFLGSASASAMYGGAGNDTYFLAGTSDSIVEAAGEGADRVATSASFVLAAGSEVEFIEFLDLSGTAAMQLRGNETAQRIVGNNGANLLDAGGGNDLLLGLGGNDTLVGGQGDDSMEGGTGDDVYFIDSIGDRIVETSGQGYDRLAAAVSYSLAVGASIEIFETVSLNDTAALNLMGNALSQYVIGNNGNNLLQSGGGNDWLIGAGGNDTIVGSSSASTMEGGLGDDVYFVSDSSDYVVELSSGGSDRIAAATSYALSALAEVEQLEAISLGDLTALNFTGNGFRNTIVGNNGANFLDGKGGADVLVGVGGNDTFAFTSALGGGNVDRIDGFVSGSDRIALDDAIFTAIQPGALQAGAFVVATQAQDGDDRIIYDPASGALLYDADGIGSAAAVQFASLSGAPALTGSDFILI